MNRFITILFRFGLLLLAWFFLHCLWIVQDSSENFTGKAAIAVVLGNTVFDDGSLSPWLKGRVDEALRLYRNGQVKKIFVSGGIGKNNLPEGDAMKSYLINRSVDSSAIIVDNYGNNTFFTAKHFIELNAVEKYSSAVAVTSFYHVPRTKYIIKKMGFDAVSGASSRALFRADWYGITREFFAYYKYMLVY